MLLWNQVINELLGEMQGEWCREVGCADHLVIIVGLLFLETPVEITQVILRTVKILFEKTGLSVNSKMTEIIVFRRHFKWNRYCSLSINGKNLLLSRECKYPGVIVDGKLSKKFEWWRPIYDDNPCKK